MPCQTLEMQCKVGRVVLLRNKDDTPRVQKCNAKTVELSCQELSMLSQESRVEMPRVKDAMPNITKCNAKNKEL